MCLSDIQRPACLFFLPNCEFLAHEQLAVRTLVLHASIAIVAFFTKWSNGYLSVVVSCLQSFAPRKLEKVLHVNKAITKVSHFIYKSVSCSFFAPSGSFWAGCIPPLPPPATLEMLTAAGEVQLVGVYRAQLICVICRLFGDVSLEVIKL